MSIIDGTKTSATWLHTRQPEPHLGLLLRSLWWDATLTISQRSKHSKTPRTNTPVVGKPKKAPTASRSSFFRMLGILTSRWLTPPLVLDRLFAVALLIKSGLGLLYGQLELCGFFRSSTTEGASDVSPSHFGVALLSTWLNALQPCYAKFWTILPRCSVTLRMKCSFCLSSGSFLSIENFSTQPHATGRVE